MRCWKTIWNKDDRINRVVLEMLVKADGFDSPTGGFSLEDWISYTEMQYAKLNLRSDDAIFDVGCGSGAFVYPLFLRGHKVGGIDYSQVLISLANAIMPNSDFINKEAIKIDSSKRYDIVLSHSVFFYFKDLNYAKSVLLKMIKKANKSIAIFDINDTAKEREYHKIRMKTMTREEYKKKYNGLEHLFFTKDFFRNIAKEHGLRIEIWDQSFKGYHNSQFRFNVIMEHS